MPSHRSGSPGRVLDAAAMSQSLWATSAWREGAVAWLDERLAELGIRRSGDVEQPHLRPWATALRVPTDHGIVWLKAAGPGTAFEVHLYELLQRAARGRVLEPLVVDRERGWLVLPDGGAVLGERAKEEGFLDDYAQALAQYGVLQRELAPHVDALLERGVADMRPAILPRRFDEALEAVRPYVERQGTDAERVRYEQVIGLRDRFALGCRELAASPALPSLDHNDLHPWNIFAKRGAAGALEARFYDWGDSVIAHPFAVLLVPLTVMPPRLGIEPSDPRLLRMRDRYLEVFGDLAPHAELVATADLACRVGLAARTLVWQRCLDTIRGEPNDLAGTPLETLTALLD
jgi:hypothetical protein